MSLLIQSFLFGAANSLHCACMCGPLAMSFGQGPGGTTAYQGGRIASYSLLGAILGGTGAAFGSGEVGVPAATAAYVLAAALVLLALVGERGALKLPWLGPWLQRITAFSRGRAPWLRAGLLGLATPLLPCGLLWSACASAAVAGSTLAGSEVMAGFALGSLPLLFLAQHHAPALVRRFSPRTLAWVQKGAMLLAAAVLVWRASVAQQGGCCH